MTWAFSPPARAAEATALGVRGLPTDVCMPLALQPDLPPLSGAGKAAACPPTGTGRHSDATQTVDGTGTGAPACQAGNRTLSRRVRIPGAPASGRRAASGGQVSRHGLGASCIDQLITEAIKTTSVVAIICKTGVWPQLPKAPGSPGQRPWGPAGWGEVGRAHRCRAGRFLAWPGSVPVPGVPLPPTCSSPARIHTRSRTCGS